MECEQIKKIIPDYVTHTASDEDVQAVEEHLCVCHACRQFLSEHMDKPGEPKPQPAPAQHKTAVSGQSVGAFEYAVLAVAALVVIFLVFLFLKK